MASLCSACNGFVDDWLSMHDDECEKLSETSPLYDSLPADQIAKLRYSQVPVQRVAIRHASLGQWRGSRIIEPLWKATDLDALAWRKTVPDTALVLITHCLRREGLVLALEGLAHNPDKVEDWRRTVLELLHAHDPSQMCPKLMMSTIEAMRLPNRK